MYTVFTLILMPILCSNSLKRPERFVFRTTFILWVTFSDATECVETWSWICFYWSHREPTNSVFIVSFAALRISRGRSIIYTRKIWLHTPERRKIWLYTTEQYSHILLGMCWTIKDLPSPKHLVARTKNWCWTSQTSTLLSYLLF